jgi:hypothetical protein
VEGGGEFVVGCWGDAGCYCEGVDELEYEEAGEGSAKVGDTSDVSFIATWEKGTNLRGEKSHVGTSNDRICDSGVESRNSDEHDSVGEGREDVFGDDYQ